MFLIQNDKNVKLHSFINLGIKIDHLYFYYSSIFTIYHTYHTKSSICYTTSSAIFTMSNLLNSYLTLLIISLYTFSRICFYRNQRIAPYVSTFLFSILFSFSIWLSSFNLPNSLIVWARTLKWCVLTLGSMISSAIIFPSNTLRTL